jgi:hypothetical protein
MDVRAWSQQPPGLSPVDVPQFVAVTFDDNFVSGLGDPAGGMTWATSFFEPLVNPAGSGFAPTFDGAPVRTSFYDNCVYLEDEKTKQSWATSREDGHEIANHTVHHLNGLTFTEQAWSDEIAPCTMALTNPSGGLGVSVDDVKGAHEPERRARCERRRREGLSRAVLGLQQRHVRSVEDTGPVVRHVAAKLLGHRS